MLDEEHIKKAFDQLVGRHRKLIEFLCLKASYGQEVYYRDLLQECYLSLLKHLAERKDSMSELNEDAWVFWVCRAAITRYRRSLKLFPETLYTDFLADLRQAPDEVSQLTVDDCLSCLSGAERRCFLLMLDGASLEELQQQLGLKRRSVIQLRHNIKKKLQQYIKQ
jgi:RNA polymerase sigma factor (sigma-70 family)